MSRRLRRYGFAATSAAVGLLLCAAVPDAAPPTVETHEDEGIFTMPNIDCGAFTLHEEMISEDIRITTFFNQQGDVDRKQMKITFLGEITNSATGETFRDHAAITHFIEGGSFEFHNGLGFNIVRPGEGPQRGLGGRPQ
jgi:hypothetical protein